MEKRKSLEEYVELTQFIQQFHQEQSLVYAEKQLKEMTQEIEQLKNPSWMKRMFTNRKNREKELEEAEVVWEKVCKRPYPLVELDNGSKWEVNRVLNEIHCALEDRYQMSSELQQECQQSPSGQIALEELKKQMPEISYCVGKQLEEVWKANRTNGLETRIHRTPCKDSQLVHIFEKGLDIQPDYISAHAKDIETVPDLDFTTACISNFGQMLQFAASLDGACYHGADGMIILGVNPEHPEFSYIDPDNRLSGSIDPMQIKAYVHNEDGYVNTFFTRKGYLEQSWKERSSEELNKALEEHLKKTAQWLQVNQVPTSVYKIAEALEISTKCAKTLCESRRDLLSPSFMTKDGEQHYLFQVIPERDYLTHEQIFTKEQIEKPKEYISMELMLRKVHQKQKEQELDLRRVPKELDSWEH